MPEQEGEKIVRISAEAAAWLVAQLQGKCIAGIVHAVPAVERALFRGFKFNPGNAEKPIVRHRLALELVHNDDLRMEIMQAADAPWKAWRDCLSCLGEGRLLCVWRALARVEGGRILVAMALHDSGRVAARAERVLGRHGVWQHFPSPRPSDISILDHFARQLNVIRVKSSDVVIDTEQTTGAQELRQQLIVQQKARADAESRLERAERQLHKTGVELDERRVKTEELAAQVQGLRRHLAETQRTNERLLKEQEGIVQERLIQFRRDVLGLTPDLETVRTELAAADSQDLLQLADQLLAKQEMLNAKYGTLAQFRREISLLEQKLHDLDLCAHDSVVVTPDFSQVREQLRKRAELLRGKLSVEERTDQLAPIVRELMHKIVSVPADDDSLETLASLGHMLTLTPLLSLVGEDGLQRLKTAVSVRTEAVSSLLRERQLSRLVDSARTTRPGPKEIMNVSAELGRRPATATVHLLIDGYNCIKRVEHLRSIEASQGLAAARDELCRLCRRRGTLFAAVDVVFDGIGPVATRETQGGITVVFAPKIKEDQTADDWIVRMLSEAAAAPYWLVTFDFGLRSRAAERCEAFIRPADFFAFLNT